MPKLNEIGGQNIYPNNKDENFNSIVIPWEAQFKLKSNLIEPVFNNIQHIWGKSFASGL